MAFLYVVLNNIFNDYHHNLTVIGVGSKNNKQFVVGLNY